MKRVLLLVFVLAFALVFAQFAGAQETDSKAKKAAKKPGAVAVDAVSTTAVVDAVDASKRMVTLKAADGKTQTYKLGPAVKNFDQIKVGDKVRTTYAESVAVFVRKSDEQPSADEMRTVRVAPKGAKPGAVITDTFEVTAKVEKINYKKRTITLKGPEGNVRTFKVDRTVKRFKNIRAGDEVVLRVTEAIAIMVEKP